MMDSESRNIDEMLTVLKAILAIPEFKTIVHHKINEWMVVIGSNIEDRRKFIENEKYLERKESPGNDHNGEIEFEIHRLHGVWFPRRLSENSFFG